MTYPDASYQADVATAEERLNKAIAAGHPFTEGRDLLYALHKAGLLPQWPMCGRVIIDIDPGATVMMYVEVFASSRILHLDFTGNRWNIKVLDRIVADEPKPLPPTQQIHRREGGSPDRGPDPTGR